MEGGYKKFHELHGAGLVSHDRHGIHGAYPVRGSVLTGLML